MPEFMKQEAQSDLHQQHVDHVDGSEQQEELASHLHARTLLVVAVSNHLLKSEVLCVCSILTQFFRQAVSIVGVAQVMALAAAGAVSLQLRPDFLQRDQTSNGLCLGWSSMVPWSRPWSEEPISLAGWSQLSLSH